MNKTRTLLLTFAILAVAILLISFYDIFNDKGWRIAIFIAYGILALPLIGMVVTSRRTSLSAKPVAISTVERRFRCPSCQGTFQLSIPTDQTAFHHVCPHCGHQGTITIPSKK